MMYSLVYREGCRIFYLVLLLFLLLQLTFGILDTVRRVLETGALKMVQSLLMKYLKSTREYKNTKHYLWLLHQMTVESFLQLSLTVATQETGFVAVPRFSTARKFHPVVTKPMKLHCKLEFTVPQEKTKKHSSCAIPCEE